MRWSIDYGDCREILRDVADNSLDACVTDPPYGLGFMGKQWDSSDVAFQVETWSEILRVLKPGAHLLAFGGTRTYHRMACAIEDAGFEIRDSMHWLYGSGMPKGKSVLKPGHEPIMMARKYLIGAVAANVNEWGTGSLNIDACRIESNGEHKKTFQPTNNERDVYGKQSGFQPTNAEGRWPANVILDEDAAAELDAQAGLRRSAGNYPSESAARDGNATGFTQTQGRLYADAGGASRFFYTAKASKRERNTGCAVSNNHPTVKPVSLMRYLVRLVTPKDGLVLDPFCGSGTTGVASVLEGLRFAGIEQNQEYIEIAQQRLRHADQEAEQDSASALER